MKKSLCEIEYASNILFLSENLTNLPSLSQIIHI